MIEIQDLHYKYRKSPPLYEGLDLRLEPGNIYGLLGRNGAGKTTLLKLITGLLFPQTGFLDVLGYNPQDRLPSFLSDVFFIQEEIYLPEMRIEEYRKLYAPFYHNFDEAAFDKLITEFELDQSRKTNELSYGQKKKVLLSFGIATNSKVLILDEPTNGLDIPSKSQFRRILAKAITDERIFLISTHQVRDMNNLIDPILILENGKILFNQSTYDVSRKLRFYNSYEAQEPSDALFAERIPGGYQVVVPNTTNDETEVDIEALFNTVIGNRDTIDHLFNNTYHEV